MKHGDLTQHIWVRKVVKHGDLTQHIWVRKVVKHGDLTQHIWVRKVVKHGDLTQHIWVRKMVKHGDLTQHIWVREWRGTETSPNIYGFWNGEVQRPRLTYMGFGIICLRDVRDLQSGRERVLQTVETHKHRESFPVQRQRLWRRK